jgi:hypothetical protein
MIKKTIVLVIPIVIGCILLVGCKKQATTAKDENTEEIKKEKVMENVLSEVEKEEGWQLLFDGKSLKGWHKYGTNSIGKAWVISDQSIHLDVSDKKEWQAKNGGDIISKDEFSNFHLKLDWKIAKNGNSGIIFYVHEDSTQFKYPWMTGPEMQVLDNNGHPDAKIIKHRAGDLYDLITSKETVKPANEWNHAEIIARKGTLEFYLNAVKVLETTMWDDNWKQMIAKSKFKEFQGFGTYTTGKLCLQDHGDKVWFKNIKVKELK